MDGWTSCTVRLANLSGTYHHEDFSRYSENDGISTTSSGGPSRTNENAWRTRLRSQPMLEISHMVTGTSADKPKGI